MDVLVEAFLNLITPSHLFFLALGTLLGLLVGILPGLGGIAGLSLVLPFIYGMDPSDALAMMIGLLAPTTTSDTFPSVLMGIPGTSGSQATVMDGFPMAKRGEGARALGAAFSASLYGGLVGALILTGAVFAARPIILAIGFGEQLLLIVLALSMIGVLTGTSAIKGLATCGVGLLIGTIGAAPATGGYRLTGDSVYLSDGIPIVIIGLGMFAMPEIIDLIRSRSTISETGTLGHGQRQGFRDFLRHPWLVTRCAFIGTLVGALPGLGGSVVDWIAYGHVIQTSKDKSGFGHGDIRGVLAPESANNAKEGGALIPTLLFGIPGSGSMALLLGGFILIGIEPGPSMVTTDLNLTFTMIWSLALANVLGAGICFAFARQVAKLTTIPYGLLAPIMLVLIFFASFQATRSWSDLIALFLVGTLGVYMKRFGWSRPALLIGFFLSGRLEGALYQSIQVYGLSFFERPIVIGLLILTVISVWAALRFKPGAHETPDEKRAREAGPLRPQLVFAGIMLAAAVITFVDSFLHAFLAMIFPLVVSVFTIVLMGIMLAELIAKRQQARVYFDTELNTSLMLTNVHYLAWIAGLLAATGLVGFPMGALAFLFIFMTVKAGGPPLRNFVLAGAGMTFLGAMSYFLTLRYPEGLLQTFVEMPWWLGG